MSIYKITDEVEKAYGEDLLLEMINPDTRDERVSIDTVIKHDVINKEIYGSVTVDGVTKYYQVEDGNNNGTVFHVLSDKPFSQPKTRMIRVPKIVPLVETPLSLAKAKAMQAELNEIERNISYDSYVTSASLKTTQYWADKVAALKGKIVYEEIEIPV